MKHISATLLTVFCLFTAGLVARGGPAPSHSGVDHGHVARPAPDPAHSSTHHGHSISSPSCEIGYSIAIGDKYNDHRMKYPDVLLCVNESTKKLAIMHSDRIKRIDLD